MANNSNTNVLSHFKKMIEEARVIGRMHKEGKTVDEIAAATGRSKSVIRRVLRQMTFPDQTSSESDKK